MEKIKKVKAFCVVRYRSVAREKFFGWRFLGRKEPQEGMAIFPSKRKAMAWVAQWKNYQDFTVLPIEFEIPKYKTKTK